MNPSYDANPLPDEIYYFNFHVDYFHFLDIEDGIIGFDTREESCDITIFFDGKGTIADWSIRQ